MRAADPGPAGNYNRLTDRKRNNRQNRKEEIETAHGFTANNRRSNTKQTEKKI